MKSGRFTDGSGHGATKVVGASSAAKIDRNIATEVVKGFQSCTASCVIA